MSVLKDRALALAQAVVDADETSGVITFPVKAEPGELRSTVKITYQVGNTVILEKGMFKSGEFVQFHAPNTCQCCGR